MNQANGDGRPKPQDDNIVPLPTLAERDRMRREKEKLERAATRISEPMINLPHVTKWLLGIILAIFLVTNILLPAEYADLAIGTFGFVPEAWHADGFNPLNLMTPFTHMFFHGGWMHVMMNLFMLAAFGSGVERWLGGKKTLILFIASGLFGVLAHYLLNTASPYPMIGASGGLSGLFAAALIMMSRGQREMGGRFGILPFAIIWIGLSIGFGMLGGPDGSMVAWAAHVGGFIGGFIVLKAMRA